MGGVAALPLGLTRGVDLASDAIGAGVAEAGLAADGAGVGPDGVGPGDAVPSPAGPVVGGEVAEPVRSGGRGRGIARPQQLVEAGDDFRGLAGHAAARRPDWLPTETASRSHPCAGRTASLTG